MLEEYTDEIKIMHDRLENKIKTEKANQLKMYYKTMFTNSLQMF